MIAILRGIRLIDYVSKKDDQRKQGIELHCERKPYPGEPYVEGSDVVFTEYIPMNENNSQFVNRIKALPIMTEIDLVYVQNGRFSNLVDVTPIK